MIDPNRITTERFRLLVFGMTTETPLDPDDDLLVSSIEQYQQALLGNPDPRYNPSQFSITTGDPLASVTQYDVGLFVTDDWTLNEKLTLGFGLRYENQTNLDDGLNFAPRLNFAWAPAAGGDKPAKTVIRGGFGVFYSRFGANTVLTAERLDGTRQQQFVIANNDAILGLPVFGLDGVTNVPTAAQLSAVAPLTNTPWLLANDLQAPYTLQGALSWERSFAGNTNLSVYYVRSRNMHLIRNRNINAPVCPPGFDCPTNDPIALNALRPDPTLGNLYQFESSGVQDQQQLIFGFRKFSRAVSIFGSYRISDIDGNTGGFPSYSYDTDLDFASSGVQRRHFLFFGSSFRLPWQEISVRPFFIAGSGSPFNITTGFDNNGDSIFNDRPAFGDLAATCTFRGISADWCGFGEDPLAIVPRKLWSRTIVRDSEPKP